MTEQALFPMKLTPAYKNYLWGGQKLRENYNKHSDLEKVAESWELSCHKDGQSTIADGKYKGLTLSEYIEKAGKSVLGTACEDFKQFPVLVKLIDAAKSLSVQVHPDDAYALKNEGEYGKTEMWYIVDCDEGAELLYGFNRSISKDEFRRRIEDNTLLDVLNSVPVKKGDVFFIEAGTIHAIGKGIVICEVQQSSNSTYRVYDFGRKGADGKPRQLHIEKALDVTVTKPVTNKQRGKTKTFDGYTVACLGKCDYFTADLLDVKTGAALKTNIRSFQSLTCVEGSVKLNSEGGTIDIKTGETVFIPAGAGDYSLSGTAKLLCVHL